MSFDPDWAVHPGEILYETLQERNLNQTELARRSGWTLKHINRVIGGHANMTARFALMLERELGSPPAEFWMNLQIHWDLFHLRRRVKS